MVTVATEKIIQEIVKKIATEYQPEKIILFGSYAWGEPGPNSDLDFLIIKETDKRRIDRERELMNILFGYNFPAMDLLVYTPQEFEFRRAMNDFFINDILQKGKVLYAK